MKTKLFEKRNELKTHLGRTILRQKGVTFRKNGGEIRKSDSESEAYLKRILHCFFFTYLSQTKFCF